MMSPSENDHAVFDPREDDGTDNPFPLHTFHDAQGRIGRSVHQVQHAKRWPSGRTSTDEHAKRHATPVSMPDEWRCFGAMLKVTCTTFVHELVGVVVHMGRACAAVAAPNNDVALAGTDSHSAHAHAGGPRSP